MVLKEMRELWEAINVMRGKVTPVILDLEESLRAKGDMTKEEELSIDSYKLTSTVLKAFSTMVFAFGGYYTVSAVDKFLGEPLTPRLPRIGMAAATAWFGGKVMYYVILQASAELILKHDQERMKMELANIILNKHSDVQTLVAAVNKHFIAEHLFSDQYQDKPLFRWRLRHTFVDSTFKERVKEFELENSNGVSRSVSGQGTANTRSLGDLMEDPLACILGSPDSNTESNKSAEHKGTIVKRGEMRAHRRSHRHHHRHADKFSAL
uniref:Uncharacterized protein n=1 Tax=Leersia perrieri TaxID=77586 RepID=A0A0D9XJX5_9ORYZ